MSRVGAREYSNSYLFYFGFFLKSDTFSHTIPPPLTTQRARASDSLNVWLLAILVKKTTDKIPSRKVTEYV